MISSTEVYIGQDGNVYKINKFSEHPIFFWHKELSQEKIDRLLCSLHNKKSLKQMSAGFSNKPAANFGVRITTQDHIQGGDILPDV